jgi:DNA mismatch endonuclease (patch repair protein)
MDTLTREERSERMRRIRSRDTGPELELRRIVWALGYRYRKNRRDLIGQPDIAFIARRRAIFLHGCFWHRHNCASGRRTPKSRHAFWNSKFKQNVLRDAQVLRELKAAGWRALVIWECQVRKHLNVGWRVRRFLDA